jgi:hypothetical protein
MDLRLYLGEGDLDTLFATRFRGGDRLGELEYLFLGESDSDDTADRLEISGGVMERDLDEEGLAARFRAGLELGDLALFGDGFRDR